MPPEVAKWIIEQEEKKIFQALEKLDWVREEEYDCVIFRQYFSYEILINKEDMTYKSNISLNMKEHQLLHKLFELWGWFDE